jgi:replicative DNA helicase
MLQRHADIDPPDSPDPYGVWRDEYVGRAMHNQFGALMPILNRLLSAGKPMDAVNEVIRFVEQTQSIRSDGARDLTNMVVIGEEVLAEFQRLRSLQGLSGIPSGWRSLDATTHGFQRGDLIVFAARPGVGKSTVAARLAIEAHRAGHIPLIVSMEMKRLQLGARLVGILGGLNMRTLRRGELVTPVEELIASAVAELNAKLPFYFIEGQFRQDVNELAALVHSLAPALLIVDGAYLLKLPGANSRMPLWERIGEIAQRLKTLAATTSIPTICTFQINREGGKKDKSGNDLGVEHLQLSDAIGQLASLIVAVFNDEEEDALDQDRRRRLKILKGREGEAGEFYIHWNWDRCDFSEVASDDIQIIEESREQENPINE